jgi:hypothetical protein
MDWKLVKIIGDQRPRWGLISPLSCVYFGHSHQCQYLSNYI